HVGGPLEEARERDAAYRSRNPSTEPRELDAADETAAVCDERRELEPRDAAGMTSQKLERDTSRRTGGLDRGRADVRCEVRTEEARRASWARRARRWRTPIDARAIGRRLRQ